MASILKKQKINIINRSIVIINNEYNIFVYLKRYDYDKQASFVFAQHVFDERPTGADEKNTDYQEKSS